MLTERKLTLNVSGAGKGTVHIDGFDLSSVCSGVDVKIRSGEVTEITLHIPMLHIDGEVSAKLEHLMVSDTSKSVD